jgi:AcrR family transcriptional regulator
VSSTTVDITDRRTVEERRTQLVDAAVEVLAAEGLERATTRRITDHAGLALGAFHYAFRSKRDLIEAVMGRVIDSTESALRSALDALEPALAAGASADEALGRAIETFWRGVEASPQLQLAQRELTVHALRDPALRPVAQQQYDRYARAVELLLERVPGVPSGQARADLARFLVATLDGLALHRLVDEDPAAGDRRLALFVDTLRALLDREPTTA